MPQGDKSKYTSKQKRKAEHIAEGYEDKGVSKKEAKSRAWATVNKDSGGGKKSGSGRGKTESHSSSRKGGKKASRKNSPPRPRTRTRQPRTANRDLISTRSCPAPKKLSPSNSSGIRSKRRQPPWPGKRFSCRRAPFKTHRTPTI